MLILKSFSHLAAPWNLKQSFCVPAATSGDPAIHVRPYITELTLKRWSQGDTAIHLQRLGPAFILVAALTVLHTLMRKNNRQIKLGYSWTVENKYINDLLSSFSELFSLPLRVNVVRLRKYGRRNSQGIIKEDHRLQWESNHTDTQLW